MDDDLPTRLKKRIAKISPDQLEAYSKILDAYSRTFFPFSVR